MRQAIVFIVFGGLTEVNAMVGLLSSQRDIAGHSRVLERGVSESLAISKELNAIWRSLVERGNASANTLRLSEPGKEGMTRPVGGDALAGGKEMIYSSARMNPVSTLGAPRTTTQIGANAHKSRSSPLEI